jgi:hypothetical protein
VNKINTSTLCAQTSLQQQQLLLRMEYEYEKEEFQRLTQTMALEER